MKNERFVFIVIYANPYPTVIFLSRKCCLLFMSVAFFKCTSEIDFFMEANNMNLKMVNTNKVTAN